MATESIKRCDVTGVARDVKTYEVIVREVGAEAWVFMGTVDLGVRGLDRLRRMIDRGMKPPTSRGGDEDEGPTLPLTEESQ